MDGFEMKKVPPCSQQIPSSWWDRIQLIWTWKWVSSLRVTESSGNTQQEYLPKSVGIGGWVEHYTYANVIHGHQIIKENILPFIIDQLLDKPTN